MAAEVVTGSRTSLDIAPDKLPSDQRGMSERRVFVVGVGMSKFCKPARKGETAEVDLPDHAEMAVTRALEDACLTPKDVESAVCGNIFFGE